VFLVDDIILSPIRGLIWVFREIHSAAGKDLAAEPAAITARLGELYMMLETGQLNEAEFDAQEKTLLDRLDFLKSASVGDAEDAGDDSEENEAGEEDEPDGDGEAEVVDRPTDGAMDRVRPGEHSQGRADS